MVQYKMSSNQQEDKILFSNTNHPFLSNFHPSLINVDGVLYHHVEGYYQACKHKGTNDDAANYISKFKDPSACKVVARSIPMTKEREKEWEDGMKIDIMRKGIFAKFHQHPDLADLLLSTGDAELVEYAPWDEYWGSGKYGLGQNKLGELLMEVRLNL